MTISHGFIYIRQAECTLNFSTPPPGVALYPKRKQFAASFCDLQFGSKISAPILNSPVPHEILRAHRTFRAAKGMKMFPLGWRGSFRECASEALTWHLPTTEAHSQLGTNSGASALKDAAETPPLGPFAWDNMFLAEDTSKASRFQTH